MNKDIRLTGTIEGKHINSLHDSEKYLRESIQDIYMLLNETQRRTCGKLHFCDYEDCHAIVKSGYITPDPMASTKGKINSVSEDGVGIYSRGVKFYYCWRHLEDLYINGPYPELWCEDDADDESAGVTIIAHWLAQYHHLKLTPRRENDKDQLMLLRLLEDEQMEQLVQNLIP